MTTLTHDTEHSARGVDRLIDRYARPRTSALLASWLAEVQEAEDALWQLLVERSLGTAEGDQLDVLGSIVGQPRRGMDDDTYRMWISARNLVNRSRGKTTDILKVARAVSPLGTTIALEEYYPASFVVRLNGDVDFVADDLGYAIANMLHLAKGAGILLGVTWPMAGVGERFTFSPEPDIPVLDSPLGFDEGHFDIVTDGSSVPPEIDEPTALEGQIVIQGTPVVLQGVPLVITPPAARAPLVAKDARIVPRAAPPVPVVLAPTIELEDAFADASLEMTPAGDLFRVSAAAMQFDFPLRTSSVSTESYQEIALMRFDATPFGAAFTLVAELEVSAAGQTAHLELWNMTAGASVATLTGTALVTEQKTAAVTLPLAEQLYSVRLKREGGLVSELVSCRAVRFERA